MNEKCSENLMNNSFKNNENLVKIVIKIIKNE